MSAGSVTVHPSNVEAQRGWGADGEFWAANDARFEANMAAYEPHLLTAAAISSGDSVLDVGCGTGPTTRDAARLTIDGKVVGIDLSPAMIARARERTGESGLPNVDFVLDLAVKAEANLRESLAAHAGPNGVAYRSAAWIITARSAT